MGKVKEEEKDNVDLTFVGDKSFSISKDPQLLSHSVHSIYIPVP